MGAEKALRDSGIVSKQGFIGRTLTVGDTGDHDLFIRADARTLTEILVEQKKATVVTPHPADSYELITNADKVVYKLVITDPERFMLGLGSLITFSAAKAATETNRHNNNNCTFLIICEIKIDAQI